MKNVKYAIFYYLGLAGCLMVLIFSFYLSTLDINKYHLPEMSAGDAALLMSVYWISPKRIRGVMTVWFWIITIFLYANVLYMRYWNDIIPFNAIFDTSSYNGLVFKAVPTLLRIQDLIYLVAGVAVTVMWYKQRGNKNYELSGTLRTIALIITWTFSMGCTMLTTLHNYRYYKSVGVNDIEYLELLKSRIECKERSTQTWCISNQGLTIYVVDNLYHTIRSQKMELTAKERKEIEQMTQSRLEESKGLQLKGNENKNLIFIVVESLNADYIGKIIGGKDLTPTLSMLIGRSGTIYASNMEPQIKAGGSSDGQMIYNTGLLPISTGCAALMFGNNEYHSIAEALNREQSIEIISDKKEIWNHVTTSKSYGYDDIYDIRDFAEQGIYAEETGGDAALFTYAIGVLKELERPFYAELTTISMHYPFEDAKAHFEGKITDEMVPETLERKYCESLKYFDKQLGIFLRKLQNEGLAENTVIVIASDHDQATHESEDLKDCHPIAFIAVNTGKTMLVESKTYQADVYPTILDIMGVEPQEWRGVGHSMMGKARVDEEAQYVLSDKIIRSNYFKRK